jgi:hypothetical protein
MLGSTSQRVCTLASNIWGVAEKVSDSDNEQLMLTFSEKELEAIVSDMNQIRPWPGRFFANLIYKDVAMAQALGAAHLE